MQLAKAAIDAGYSERSASTKGAMLAKDPDVLAYIEAVQKNKVRDQVISFQMRNGFEPVGILNNYLSKKCNFWLYIIFPSVC